MTEHDRAQTLFESGALPRQRLDAAETAHRAAVAQRDLAQGQPCAGRSRRCGARAKCSATPRYAPVAGFVVERNYDAGAMPGDLPVVVVADLRRD